MGNYIDAGYAERLNDSYAGIHIGRTMYEISDQAVQHLLMYGLYSLIYQRGLQNTLELAGRISLSPNKQSVMVQPNDGRLYIINADALRDVMRGKIPRATVSEVVFSKPREQKTLAA